MKASEVVEILKRFNSLRCTGAVRCGVNARQENGSTPLHGAGGNNPNSDVIDALLDAGANAKLRNNDGKLPADYAVENESIKDSPACGRLREQRMLSIMPPDGR